MSQFTLDIEAPILKIWDMSITGRQFLHSAVEAIGRIDKGGLPYAGQPAQGAVGNPSFN